MKRFKMNVDAMLLRYLKRVLPGQLDHKERFDELLAEHHAGMKEEVEASHAQACWLLAAIEHWISSLGRQSLTGDVSSFTQKTTEENMLQLLMMPWIKNAKDGIRIFEAELSDDKTDAALFYPQALEIIQEDLALVMAAKQAFMHRAITKTPHIIWEKE